MRIYDRKDTILISCSYGENTIVSIYTKAFRLLESDILNIFLEEAYQSMHNLGFIVSINKELDCITLYYSYSALVNQKSYKYGLEGLMWFSPLVDALSIWLVCELHLSSVIQIYAKIIIPLTALLIYYLIIHLLPTLLAKLSLSKSGMTETTCNNRVRQFNKSNLNKIANFDNWLHDK